MSVSWSLILRYLGLLLLVSMGLMPWARGTREYSLFLAVMGVPLLIGSAMTARATWRVGGSLVSLHPDQQARVGLLAASVGTAVLGAIMIAGGLIGLLG